MCQIQDVVFMLPVTDESRDLLSHVGGHIVEPERSAFRSLASSRVHGDKARREDGARRRDGGLRETSPSAFFRERAGPDS